MGIRIGHLALLAKDMPASLKFYNDALGITKAFSILNDDGKPWIEYLKVADGQFIELFYNGQGEAQTGPFRHLCLTVDDIYAATKRVEAAGYTMDSQPRQGKDGNWQSWVVDPDGVRVELMQISPDSLQAKSSQNR